MFNLSTIPARRFSTEVLAIFRFQGQTALWKGRNIRIKRESSIISPERVATERDHGRRVQLLQHYISQNNPPPTIERWMIKDSLRSWVNQFQE